MVADACTMVMPFCERLHALGRQMDELDRAERKAHQAHDAGVGPRLRDEAGEGVAAAVKEA